MSTMDPLDKIAARLTAEYDGLGLDADKAKLLALLAAAAASAPGSLAGFLLAAADGAIAGGWPLTAFALVKAVDVLLEEAGTAIPE